MTIENEKEVLRAASFVLEKEVKCISELSDNQIIFFAALSPTELNRCFAIQDTLSGKSLREVAIKYGISKSRIEQLINERKY